jgi:hypothetical protein
MPLALTPGIGSQAELKSNVPREASRNKSAFSFRLAFAFIHSEPCASSYRGPRFPGFGGSLSAIITISLRRPVAIVAMTLRDG